MSLNWYWSKKVGEVERTTAEGETFRNCLYRGNAYIIEIWESEKDNSYYLANFWADKTHAKRCLGLVKGYDNLYRDDYRVYTLYADMLGELDKDFISLLIKGLKDKVEIRIVPNPKKGDD